MPDDVDLRARPTATTLLAIAAAGAIAPFIVSSSSTSFSTVNGQVTHFVYRDWIAVAGGGSAVLFGLLAVLYSLRAKAMSLVAAAVVLALLGGYQIARGLGMFAVMPASEMQSELSLPALPPQPKSVPPTIAIETCPDATTCDDLASTFQESAPEKWLIGKERGCGFKQAHDCLEAGNYYTEKKQSLEKAAGLYDHGCKLDQADACLNLGVHTVQGEGVAKDLAAGIALEDKGCTLGSVIACKNLGFTYLRGDDGVAKDPAKGFAYFEKSCRDNGYAMDDAPSVAAGCDGAGVALFEGIGTKLDAAKGYGYFEKACGLAERYCKNLGIAANIGKGTKQDQPKARVLFGKACDAGSGAACAELAVMLRKGEGGAKDLVAAKTAADAACKADDPFCPKK